MSVNVATHATSSGTCKTFPADVTETPLAAKGSSIVQVLDADKKQLKALSGWIVP